MTEPNSEEKMSLSNQLENNERKNLSFTLRIPIFNRFQTQTQINNAKISVLNAKYNLELDKNKLYERVQQAYTDASAALKQYIATKKTVKSTREAFNYTQQRFNVGLVNSLDYNIAKNHLSKAKSDLLQAKYNYIFKTKILDFYMGKQLKL